ncbi:lipase, partial [Helicobacter sp. T3_23-1059]
TQVALILPNARGLKKYNDDYPIMQDLCVSGVFSDKGFPIICTKKENTLKIQSPKPSNNNAESKEAIKPNITLTKPPLRLHYKEYEWQKDNVLIARFYLNGKLQEKAQDEHFSNVELDFDKVSKDIENTKLKDKIVIDYPNKYYDLRQVDIMLGIHHLCLIFVIPTKIPKIFKESYKSYEYKEYGAGKYKALFAYNADFENIKDSSDSSDSNESCDDITITHIRAFLAPAKAKKLDFVFAVGLDSWLENENVCSFKIMADDVWYDNIQDDDDTKSNENSSDSQSTQDSQKEIIEMYFSYGEEMVKLESDDSRHSSDMNLHIVTRGYNDDEQMEIEVKTQSESFIINATICDNQALLKNVFNGRNIPIGEIEIYA